MIVISPTVSVSRHLQDTNSYWYQALDYISQLLIKMSSNIHNDRIIKIVHELGQIRNWNAMNNT